MSSSLQIQVLGPISVRWNGQAIPLPASKKTRALLGFLALAPTAHGRGRLCDLLWEGPADPRGALRWSLSRIRSLVEQDGSSRIQSDRDTVRFDSSGVDVDLHHVTSIHFSDLDQVSTERLAEAAGLFRGELLEGLDLTNCYHYHAWVMRERDVARALRVHLLRELAVRGRGGEEGVLQARTWVGVAPLSEEAHLTLMQRLADIGRTHEARMHCETSAALLRRELGAAPERLARWLREHPRSRAPEVSPRPSDDEPEPKPVAGPSSSGATDDAAYRTPGTPLVARTSELQAIDDLVRTTVEGQATELFFFGEAGLGKTRLLEELGHRFVEQGGRVLAGRAFEAEMLRSYGAWLDLLAGVDVQSLPADLKARIEPLISHHATPIPTAGATRDHLYETVTDLLEHLAGRCPHAILIDDLQWLDEGSIALLHYVTRTLDRGTRLLIAGTARPGELIDNPPVLSVLRSLRRQHHVRQFDLAPLSLDDAARIAEGITEGIDVQGIAAESEGNPLLLIELAHARARGETRVPESIEDLFQQRLDLLDEVSTELLPWAAALGRTFSLDVLAKATGRDLLRLAAALETLERRAILRTTAEGQYDFAHDLVRRTIYERISVPRRSILHRRIARSLAGGGDLAVPVAGDVAHHAELGHDLGLAARAAAVTGKQSLRLFANQDAWAIADRGLRLINRLEGEQDLALRMDLLEIKVLAAKTTALRHQGEIQAELEDALARAQAKGRSGITAKGFYLLSVLHEDQGETSEAERASIQAARSGRSSDALSSARQLANTARCIIQLEGDVEHARGLLAEAHALAEDHALQDVELLWGQGLLGHWDGNVEEALDAIQKALALARSADDRWRECSCLAWLGILAFTLQDLEGLRDWSQQLVEVSTRMGELGKAAFGRALQALAARADGSPGAESLLDQALQGLRGADAKAHLSWTLNRAARQEIDEANQVQARTLAQEALTAAEAVRRPSEAARARILLARCGFLDQDPDSAMAHLQHLRDDLDRELSLDQDARQAIVNLLAGLPGDPFHDHQT